MVCVQKIFCFLFDCLTLVLFVFVRCGSVKRIGWLLFKVVGWGESCVFLFAPTRFLCIEDGDFDRLKRLIEFCDLDVNESWTTEKWDKTINVLGTL